MYILPTKGGFEHDVFCIYCRRVHSFPPGHAKSIKRKYNKRVRKYFRVRLKKDFENVL